MGRKGYLESAKRILETAGRIRRGIEEIEELEVPGDRSPCALLLDWRPVDRPCPEAYPAHRTDSSAARTPLRRAPSTHEIRYMYSPARNSPFTSR